MTNTNKHGVDHEVCPIKMVEIYGGKDEKWKGWHNLIINEVAGRPIAGPLDPELSKPLLGVIKAWNTRANDRTIELENKLQEAVDFIQRLGPTIDYPILDEIRGLLR